MLGSGDILLLTLGGLAGVALWGAIGSALGAIIHNQVGAVITLLAWGFVIDTLLFGLAPGRVHRRLIASARPYVNGD